MPRLRRSSVVLATPCVLALTVLFWHRSPLSAPNSQPTRVGSVALERSSSPGQDGRREHGSPAAAAELAAAARRRRFPPHGLFEGTPRRPVSADSLHCHALDGDPMQTACLPLVLGISCVHCGSSSLAAYLNAHPQLSHGAHKEHHFFPDRSNSDRSGRLLKYSKQFLLPVPSQGELQTYGLDFTPGYLSKSAMDERVISQVAELPAETRFIVILKSAQEFMRGRLREKATFKCLEDQQCWQDIRRLCCQHIQLEAWLAQFDRQRFFFVRSEDLAELSNRSFTSPDFAKARLLSRQNGMISSTTCCCAGNPSLTISPSGSVSASTRTQRKY